MSYVGAADRTDGCLFGDARASSDDRKVLVLLRRPLAFLILNAFPYASGPLMAALTRRVGTLGEATAAELSEGMALVRAAVRALDRVYHPDQKTTRLNS